MDTPPADPVNHHADQHHFGGPIGLFVGLAMFALGRTRARLVVDMADVSGSDRVVDIGCGPGNAVRAAAHRGASVIGVDPSRLMLGLARALTRDRTSSWVQGSAENLPLPDDSATVVWSAATVHHWADVTAGLGEVRRVLCPGGRFLAIERQVRPGATGLASHGWTDQQAALFAEHCRAAGFHDVRVETPTGGRGVFQVVKAIKR